MISIIKEIILWAIFISILGISLSIIYWLIYLTIECFQDYDFGLGLLMLAVLIIIFGGMSFVNIVQKKREQKAYAA